MLAPSLRVHLVASGCIVRTSDIRLFKWCVKVYLPSKYYHYYYHVVLWSQIIDFTCNYNVHLLGHNVENHVPQLTICIIS